MRIGKALRLSDSQVEELSQVFPLDIEAARAYWTQTVPARYKSLLEAQTVGEGKLSSSYVWDASAFMLTFVNNAEARARADSYPLLG